MVTGSNVAKKTYLNGDCTGTFETTQLSTADGNCVANTARLIQSGVPVPYLSGYLTLSKFDSVVYCSNLRDVMTFKLNECIIGDAGLSFIYTIYRSEYTESKYSFVLTEYSDRMCTTKTGYVASGDIRLDACTGQRTATVTYLPYELVMEQPMVTYRLTDSC